MDKYKLIAVALILGSIVGIVIIIMIIFGGQDSNNNDRLSLSTTDGQSLEVKDFNKESQIYDRAVVLYANSNYTIQYDNIEKRFQITFSVLTLEDFNKYRGEAEDIFLEKLGVTQAEACRIKVVERTFSNIEDSDLPDKDYPMSFCQGGTINY